MGYRNYRPKKEAFKTKRFSKAKRTAAPWAPPEDDVPAEGASEADESGQKYNAKDLLRALRRGAGCIETGGDLSRLTPSDRDLIEIKSGGRLGLTPGAYQYAKRMAGRKGPQQAGYTAVLDAARSLMNKELTTPETEASEAPEQPPQSELDQALSPDAEPPPEALTPETITEVLQEAKVLVSAGQDLSSLPPWKRVLVRIQPPSRPKLTVQTYGGKSFAVPALSPKGEPIMEPNPLAGTVELTKPACEIMHQNAPAPQPENKPAPARPKMIRWLPRLSWFLERRKEENPEGAPLHIATSLTFTTLIENLDQTAEDTREADRQAIHAIQRKIKCSPTQPIPFSKDIRFAVGSPGIAWLARKLGPSDSTILGILANDGSIVVKRAVAQNPSTRAQDLDLLCRDNDEETRKAVARNPSASADTLYTLINDADSSVRIAVAQNTNVTDEQLEILATDTDPYVRSAVAAQIDTPRQILENLQKDIDPSVRREAANNPAALKPEEPVRLENAPPPTATEEKMVLLAAERGALGHLPVAAFQALHPSALKKTLPDGKTLEQALIDQVATDVLVQAPHILTPLIAWNLANKDLPTPSKLPHETRQVLMADDVALFKPASESYTTAQLLAQGPAGGPWALYMPHPLIKTLFTGSTLEKLEADVAKLIPQPGIEAKDKLFVAGAQLRRTDRGLAASDALGVVLALGLTPEAMSLERTIAAANKLEAFMPKPLQKETSVENERLMIAMD